MITATSISSRSLNTWSPRPGADLRARRRHALKLMNQVNDNVSKVGAIKRKRPVPIYSSGSDTDEEEEPTQEQPAYARRHLKCPRTTGNLLEKLAAEACDDKGSVGRPALEPLNLDDTLRPGNSMSEDKVALDIEHEADDELTIEYARSSEPLQEVDLGAICDNNYASLDDDLYEEWESSSSDGDRKYQPEHWERSGKYLPTYFTCTRTNIPSLSAVQKYIKELPTLLTRRYRKEVLSQRAHYIDDEPLRVKFLNRQFKNKLGTGDFTEEQIYEVILQRPLYGTFADLNIPTPRMMPESDSDLEVCDLTELEFEEIDLDHPERPSTPIPHSDSDEDSESDEEYAPVYSASQISQQLSRREMESMGIYPEDDE